MAQADDPFRDTFDRLGAWGVPGYRSGVGWKQLSASLGYALLPLVLVAACSTATRPAAQVQPAVSAPAQATPNVQATVAAAVQATTAAQRPAQPTATRAPAATATLAVSELTRAEAANLLGAAVTKRQEGQLGLALELSNQALGKWRDYPDARAFLAEVVPQATQQAQQAQAAATAAAQQASAQATAQAKATADQAAAAAAQQAAADVAKHRETFLNLIRAAGMGSNVVVRVERGVVDDQLRVTVGNAWHSQPYQIRLQAAQNLWEAWARIHTPADPDHSRLRLVDLNGNDVGGSSFLAGSMVSVPR